MDDTNTLATPVRAFLDATRDLGKYFIENVPAMRESKAVNSNFRVMSDVLATAAAMALRSDHENTGIVALALSFAQAGTGDNLTGKLHIWRAAAEMLNELDRERELIKPKDAPDANDLIAKVVIEA